jgi:tetratricopeptide (TPR) repeat protein
MSRAAQLAVLIIVILAPAVAVAQNAGNALTEGIYTESVLGDLDKAIELYKQAAQVSDNPSVVARATYRLGNCYRKLGKLNLARGAYRRIVDRYAAQEAVVRLAKLALLSTGPSEEDLKQWTNQLKALVMRLKSAYEALGTGLARMKQEAGSGAPGAGKRLAGVVDKTLVNNGTGAMAKHFFASVFLKMGIKAYRSLDYERALGDFRASLSLNPDDRLVKSYLESTEFILGLRAKPATGTPGGKPEDPGKWIHRDLQAAFKVADTARKEGSYHITLASVESMLEQARWVDDAFLGGQARDLLEKARKLQYECVVRLYPAELHAVGTLLEERRELAVKVKDRLGEVFGTRAIERGPEDEVLDAARALINSGELPQAKELLEKHIADKGESAAVKTLLEEVNRAILGGGQQQSDTGVTFSVMAAAVTLGSEELSKLGIPFRSVKPTGSEGIPFVWAAVDQVKGKEVLSAAALSGRDAVGSFPDMNLASGKKGSGFLGSSMTYVSGFRKLAGDGGSEPVTDTVFQGIKLSIIPRSGTDKVSLSVESTVSVIAGEPRVVQTEGGQVEIPRVYQVALKHTFEVKPGQYVIVGSFPNTLVSGAAKQKEDMYLVLSPRSAKNKGKDDSGSGE